MKGFFKRYFQKWLTRRIPPTKGIILNRRNLFIFPSKNGINFLLSCFVLFLLGTNYENNLILMLVFFLSSFMVTCLLFSYQNLVGIKLTAIEVEPQFSGLDCKFEIRIDKGKSLLHDVSFSFQNTQSTLQSSLQRDKAFLYACTLQRGYFNPGRVTVHSTFPFGLYKVWTHIDFGFNALIFPSPVENESSSMFGKANNESGRFNQTTQGVEQFSSLKNYQLGESLKSVAWKQLAQGRGWLSKQFEQPAGEELLLDIKMLQHLPLESRLSFLCYQVLELDKAKQRYSLKLGAQLIEMNEGTLHKQRCLKALALFDSEYEETTI